ncbi:MAG: iron-containing alcohol dehydrogenase [Oscillospiraceae bacterium]|nr:iron-containing alcohol dehydrogenase [Oscillospiraceae bacterium]
MVYHYDQLAPVLFGNGAIELLGEKVKELGCKKVMCVYDSGVKAAGIAPKAEASLKAAGIDYVVYDKITADPTDTLVNECGAMAVEAGVDGFVGIGGGSSMDCAKAASLLLNHPAPIEQYFTAPPSFLDCPCPVVLVPTTAGTGSEVTQVCVITYSKDHSKPSIFMRSALAIVDPELTCTVPPSVTANTGLDAFTHASEAITAKGNNPRSELLAVAAIQKIAKYLPVAVKDGSNKEARFELALAANWAGIAFADTDCHLGHTMADGISSTFHTPHGYNCVLVNPEVMKLCASALPDKVQIVGEALGETFTGTETPEQIGEKTAAAVRALMRACGIKSPKEAGMDRQQFVDCYKMAMEIDFGLRMNCPVEPTAENVRAAYEQTYDNYQ